MWLLLMSHDIKTLHSEFAKVLWKLLNSLVQQTMHHVEAEHQQELQYCHQEQSEKEDLCKKGPMVKILKHQYGEDTKITFTIHEWITGDCLKQDDPVVQEVITMWIRSLRVHVVMNDIDNHIEWIICVGPPSVSPEAGMNEVDTEGLHKLIGGTGSVRPPSGQVRKTWARKNGWNKVIKVPGSMEGVGSAAKSKHGVVVEPYSIHNTISAAPNNDLDNFCLLPYGSEEIHDDKVFPALWIVKHCFSNVLHLDPFDKTRNSYMLWWQSYFDKTLGQEIHASHPEDVGKVQKGAFLNLTLGVGLDLERAAITEGQINLALRIHQERQRDGHGLYNLDDMVQLWQKKHPEKPLDMETPVLGPVPSSTQPNPSSKTSSFIPSSSKLSSKPSSSKSSSPPTPSVNHKHLLAQTQTPGDKNMNIARVATHISALEEAENFKGKVKAWTANKGSIPEHIQHIMKDAKIQHRHTTMLHPSTVPEGSVTLPGGPFQHSSIGHKRNWIWRGDMIIKFWGGLSVETLLGHHGFHESFQADFCVGFHEGFHVGFHAGFHVGFHAGFHVGFHADFHVGFSMTMFGWQSCINTCNKSLPSTKDTRNRQGGEGDEMCQADEGEEMYQADEGEEMYQADEGDERYQADKENQMNQTLCYVQKPHQTTGPD
ncbi:hypothetical protein BS47DRAFT_1358771 [Hydnum rufescens UP504]|uniref:Uncharacterized protein n=1 Tax=Hydnum rufescens UP504 TaxID=1448309 RepID=A0A9P6E1L2_9AGAM|nr:hypothetical protein BS47DRAFT_1358771 [Hydnum rufescens UP504]